MKKINYFKIILDILMAVIFVLMFNKLVIVPITFHEIAGLGVLIAFVIHIIINFNWVKQVTSKLFSSKINLRTRLGYIIDMILLLCFVTIGISGIFISKVLFSNIKISSSIDFHALHISVSYIALLLVGLHVGLHWTWAMNVFKKVFGITEKKKALGVVAKLIVVLLFVFGAYNIYSVDYFSHVSSVTSSFGGSQSGMPGGQGGNPHQNGTNGGVQAQNGTSNGSQSQSNTNGSTQTQNGTTGGHPTQGGTAEGHPTQASPNPLLIIYKYISVMSVFAIITYYIDCLLVKKKTIVKTA